MNSLIPHSHPNRIALLRQLDQVRVSIATDISQAFTLDIADAQIHGQPVRGQVSLSCTGDLLNLIMTEECAAATCPPYELVRLVADLCEIKDPSHHSLLFTALSNVSIESTASTFAQQGICIKEPIIGMT